jgi:S1-C subfamily serine protease
MATELVNLSGALAGAVERAAGSVVAVQGRPRLGTSGIVWRCNLVLTSNEGVRVEDGIRLLLPDGKAVDAKLRGRDRGTDLALLEAETGDIAPADFADDAGLKAGQLVLAVGRTVNTGPIASFGIVSGVAGEWKSWSGGKINPFVRLDVSAYPTSSGGAAVDASGKILGLVSIGLSRSSVLAITRSTIDAVAQRLLDKGYVSRGFLGIALKHVPLPSGLKDTLQLEQDSGIMLLELEPDGPAASAGLILGDVLLAAGGQTLTDPDVLADVLDQTGAGQTIEFRLLRGGAVITVQVRAGERPRRK